MVIPFDHLYDTHRASQHELHGTIHSHHNHHGSPGHHFHHGQHLIASAYGLASAAQHSPDPSLSILSQTPDHLSSPSTNALYYSAQYHNIGVDGVHHYRPLNFSKIDCQLLMQHQYLPTLSLIVSEFGNLAVFLLTVSCIITLAILFIFIEQTIVLFRRWPLRSYCTSIAILAVFPISAICFCLTLLIPRAHDINTTTATLYQPLSLVLFYKLLVSYMGREKNLKEMLMAKQIPTKGPPFYWFCVCVPSTRMNKKIYYALKGCVYQLFMAPCFLYFVMGVCSKSGVYVAGQFSFENAALYIVGLGALSFCIGIYCLEIFYKMTQPLLPGHYVCSKYYILQSYFVITRFHVLLFDALGNNGYLTCHPPITGFAYGLYIRTFLLLIFSLILSLLARHVFAKPAPAARLPLFGTII